MDFVQELLLGITIGLFACRFLQIWCDIVKQNNQKKRDECYETYGKNGECHGLYGGDMASDFLDYSCVDCPHFVYPHAD